MFKELLVGFVAILVIYIVLWLFWSWRESRRFWQAWEIRKREIDMEFTVAMVLVIQEMEKARREEAEKNAGWTPSQN